MASAKYYGNYADLAKAQVRGRDYEIVELHRGSRVVVIAPHGGKIEKGTSEVARAIAGEDFNLYCLKASNRPVTTTPSI